MKHILKRYAPLLLLTLTGLATSCDEEQDELYTELGPQFPTVLANANFTPDTKYAVGEVVPLELNFAQQTDPIKEILVLHW
jgi:hypothetical protein